MTRTKRPAWDTALFRRLHGELEKVRIVDCHEHLQRDSELPAGDQLHLGRFFAHYANCDFVSAGMPLADMTRVQSDPTLAPKERWELLAPWYAKTWNTAYCESLRIALRDLYDIEDFTDATVEPLTAALRREVKPGFTRAVFDRAGIDFAMQNPLAGPLVFESDLDPAVFIGDMTDAFTVFPLQDLAAQSGMPIGSLEDYLRVIDGYFDRFASVAGAFKCGRAYSRTLDWEDVPREVAEPAFRHFLKDKEQISPRALKALEDFVLHYLCRQCGEHGLRMKFHTGIQEGNGNVITNSRAALMCNLFLKYPRTGFDLYHISYPYEEEAAVLAKNFPNVTVDFCWMWVINPAAARRALADMLDTVPLNKIHGFGGDYIFVEGAYGHAAIARREIARVLAEKVEERRFTEDQAVAAGRRLLRDNALENFDLERRRTALRRC